MFNLYVLITKAAILSLLRRKLRNTLVILMLAISLWGLMVIQGVYDGMIKQMIENAIRSDNGQVALFAKGFRYEKDVQLQVTNTAAIIDKIKAHPLTSSYSFRVLGTGLIATANYSQSANIYGINLKDEAQNTNLNQYLKQGSYDFGLKNTGVLIGAKLAKKLKLKIGKKIILTAQNANGELSSIGLRIKGVLKTNNMALDRYAVFLDINKARDFFAINGVNQISIMLTDEMQIQSFKHDLQQAFPMLSVMAWSDAYPALLQTQELMKTFNWIIYGIVFAAVVVGIFGVILVSVLERLREFAILQIIGTNFRQIMQMILLESFIIGVAGFVLGVLLGATSLLYFAKYGIDLSDFSQALDEFGMDSIIYASIELQYFINALIAVFLASFLSVLIPLRILKKSKPIRTING